MACTPEPKGLGKNLSYWVEKVDSDDDLDRRRACEAFIEIGEPAAIAAEKAGMLLDDINPGFGGDRKSPAQWDPRLSRSLKLVWTIPSTIRLRAGMALLEATPGHTKAKDVVFGALLVWGTQSRNKPMSSSYDGRPSK